MTKSDGDLSAVDRYIEESLTAEMTPGLLQRLAVYVVNTEDARADLANAALTQEDWDFVSDIRGRLMDDDDGDEPSYYVAAYTRDDHEVRLIEYAECTSPENAVDVRVEMRSVYPRSVFVNAFLIDEMDGDIEDVMFADGFPDDYIMEEPTHWHVWAAVPGCLNDTDEGPFTSRYDAIIAAADLAEGYYGDDTVAVRHNDGLTNLPWWTAHRNKDHYESATGVGYTISLHECNDSDCH